MPEIRRAIAADAEQLFALTRDFATSFTVGRPAFDSSFGALLLQEDALLLVSDDGESLQGYVLGFDHETLFAGGPVAWVEELMVREDSRRQGIGECLMQAFEAWAQVRGDKLVALATRRAADFYTAISYEESATYFRKLLPG